MPGIRSLELRRLAAARRQWRRSWRHQSQGLTSPPGAVRRRFQLRGNYGGTSFNAPSLADSTGAVDTRVQVMRGEPIPAAPGDPFFPNFFRPTIVLAGGNPDLRKPQTAHTYSTASVETGVRPQVSGPGPWPDPGRNAAIYKGIGLVPFLGQLLFTNPSYASLHVINPTLAKAEALTAGEAVSRRHRASPASTAPFSNALHRHQCDAPNNLGNEYPGRARLQRHLCDEDQLRFVGGELAAP